ncbi:DUF6538 domain-containing protein [Maritimibacter harenae]|nr:DUF6538 domain-containing protein [Maritimibacter harenae]
MLRPGFTRRGPDDLTHHCTARRISYSLRTRSAAVAEARARQAAYPIWRP